MKKLIGNVTLPRRVRQGLELLGWCHDVNDCLQQLRDRTLPIIYDMTGTGSATYQHPFKISTSIVSEEIRLSVSYGAVLYPTVNHAVASPASVWGDTELLSTTIGGAALSDDPAGGTAGYSVLAASTEYGVWLRGSYTATSSVEFYPPADLFGRGYAGAEAFGAYTQDILVSSTYKLPADKPDNGEFWLFLGNVVIDADGLAAVKQYWRSDVVLPAFILPNMAPSFDAGNSLFIGTDGALYVPPIVSSDASNSISTGSDLGAYYNEP